VARQTRAERRARRQQAGEPALAGAGGGSGGGDETPVRLAPEPPARPERGKPGAPTREWFGARLWRFVGESWGELRKTEWPSQSHVIQGTIVVLMACIILGTFIWLCDLAFKALVHDVLLK
jgi:preprotein translocase subunit SecE